MVSMSTVDEIFKTLGGTGAAARVMEVNHSTASEMRRRKSIPVKYWPQIIEWARESGKPIDSDALVSAHVEQVP